MEGAHIRFRLRECGTERAKQAFGCERAAEEQAQELAILPQVAEGATDPDPGTVCRQAAARRIREDVTCRTSL